jgi:hypothetical protein
VVEFYQKSAFGGGTDEPVLSAETQRAAGSQRLANLVPTDWSPDGSTSSLDSGTTSRFDVWLFRLAADAKPVKLLDQSPTKCTPTFRQREPAGLQLDESGD